MKILLTVLLFCISFIANAQYPFHAPSLAAPNSDVKSRGGLGADSSIAWYGSYTDTISANMGVVDGIPGAVIRVGSRLWLRNSTATAWIAIGDLMASDTTNKWIWAQGSWSNMTHQTKNAWFDSLKLRRISIANEDSAHLDWWWKGDGDDSWTYFSGKNMWVSDNDTVTAANDGWSYSVNTNATVQRITRLNPSMPVGYRFNLLAHQIFTNGNEPASMGALGGDVGAAFYAKTMLKENPGTTGRVVINGGSPWFNATPVDVSILEVDAFNANIYATGYWSGYNSIIIVPNPDSLENFIHYTTTSYFPTGFNRNLKTQTGFFIDYTSAPTSAGYYKWGIYAPDATGASYNLLSTLGVGTSGFGSHESPSFHSSAALQINGNDRGFMTSRLTNTQMNAIASPDTAVFIWNTDSARYFGYQPGTGWRGVAWTGEGGGTDTHMGSTNLTQTGARTYAGANFDYTFNNLGTWTYNLTNENGFEIYGTTYNYFSVFPSSSGTATYLGAQTVGGYNTSLTLYSEGLDESEYAHLVVGGADFSSNIYMERNDGLKLEQIRSVGHLSRIFVKADSLVFQPDGGIINIDSLRTGTSSDEIVTWQAGMVRKIDKETLLNATAPTESWYSTQDEMFANLNGAGFTKSVSGAGSSFSYNGGYSTIPLLNFGDATLNSGTASDAFGGIGLSNGGSSPATTWDGVRRINVGFRLAFDTLATTSENYILWCGIYYNAVYPPNAITNPTHGAFFYYNKDSASGNWVARTVSSSIYTDVDTGVPVTALNLDKLEISLYDSTAYFWIDGVLVATISTTLPYGASLFVGSQFVKTAGTANKRVFYDWAAFGYKED